MRPVLCNEIIYKLYLELGSMFREHISHFHVFSGEFCVTDQLMQYLNETLAGHSNDRSTE
jgi:hypothetical protein